MAHQLGYGKENEANFVGISGLPGLQFKCFSLFRLL
ncbi:MAG: hypothetical protein IPM85_11575 [Chitinophagaceae bacterium]|nr:hypothetical protein [Chitinophagaceae bacterium]